MKHLLLFIFSFLSSLAVAQTLPTEKVFFASDKMHYDIGDTIYINGWLMRSDNKTTLPYSRYLYLEMVDQNDSIYTRQKISVDDHGAFTTVLPLEGSTHYGVYFLRAFSKMMCNFGDITIPSYPIEIRKEGFTTHHSNGGALCRIFPEGGYLSSGGIQKMAVYLSDNDGNPWQTPFSVTDAEGTVLFSSSTTASGWQMLALEPKEGVQYYIKVEGNKDLPAFAFPAIDNSKPSLRLMQRNDRIGYSIEGQIPSDAKLFAYNQSIGLVLLPVKRQGDIDVSDIGEGLVSLILTDNNYNTLSEGHIWHGKPTAQTTNLRREYSAGETLSLDSIVGDSSMTAMVRFVPLNEMTQAVTSDYLPTAAAIIHYESDLTSELPFPRHYAQGNATDRMTDIRCWLLSATFCRLDIAKAMKDGWIARYQPEVTNAIRGKIYGGGRKWKLKEGNVFAYQKSTAETFSAEMRKDGTFDMTIGDFPQGDDFFVNAFDKKGQPDRYDFDFLSDTIPAVRNYEREDIASAFNQTTTPSTTKTFNWKGVNALPEVKITARVKRDYTQEEKEFYGNKLLTEKEMDKRNYQDFQQMIYHYAPYMRFVSESPTDIDDMKDFSNGNNSDGPSQRWHLYPAMKVSTLNGKAEIKIYVDGVLVDGTNAVNLNMSDIASVEYLNAAQALAYHPFCLEGCLEIKTKKFKPSTVVSKGVKYIPAIGIANYGLHPRTMRAPKKPGEYVMIIDRLTMACTPQTIASKVIVR